MKLFFVLLSSYNLILGSKCQTIYLGSEPVFNPEQIYFADNRPVYPANLQPINANSQPNRNVQGNHNERYYQMNNAQSPISNPTQNINDRYFQANQNNPNNRQNLQNGFQYPGNQNLQNVRENFPDRFQMSRNPSIATIRPNAISNVVDITTRQNIAPLANEAQTVAPSIPVVLDGNALAITQFGLNILKELNQSSGNRVISPLSVSSVLALLQQGALGATQNQISRALQMMPQQSAGAFKKITEDVQKRKPSSNQLSTANNVFVANAFELNRAFKSIAINNFGSDVVPTSFVKAAEVAQIINEWVASKTRNKITQLIAPDNLSEDTQIVLVNAVYFKGLWQYRFKAESTVPKEFRLANGAKKMTPFMRMRKHLKAGVDNINGANILVLPFEGDEYSLMMILPSEMSTLDNVVATLSNYQLAAYHRLTVQEVDLEIPKFSIRADTDLSPIFKKMGMNNMFNYQSELSGIGNYRTFSPQISSAVHSAAISIDEDGGTAVAATAFAAVALSNADNPFLFKANRPFLAVLWDNRSAVPLIMARIEDPATS